MYRTLEQLQSIADNANNGNWSDAAKEYADAGFYVADIANKYSDKVDELFQDGWEDIALLAELAHRYR